MSISRRMVSAVCFIISAAFLGACGRKIDDDRVAAKLKLSKDSVVAIRRSGGISTRSLYEASPLVLRETARELKLPDLPQARARYEQLLLQSELGHIPPGAHLRAIQRLNELKALVATRRFAVAGVRVSTNLQLARTAGLNPEQVKWSPLGPSEVGGRTRSIVFNPKNASEIWIGSVAGGIWHSSDGGASFEAVDDFMKNLVVSTLVVDPLHPNVMYAGTGEGFLNSDALRGAGIFRTEDGVHWIQIPGTDNDQFRYVNRLAFSPDGKTLLAATSNGIFVSTDSNHANWTDTPTLSGNIGDVVFHPSDSRVAIASGAMDTSEVYHSGDAGASWQKSVHDGTWLHMFKDQPPRPSRVEICFALADPSIVYASVDANSGEIWRSADTGRTFSKMESGTPDGVLAFYLGEQGWYDNSVWASDPSDAKLLVVGGIDLWKSVDGGNSLVPISNWQNEKNVLHPDQHIIVSPPIPGATAVFVGNDGGLFKTDNIKTVGTDSANISGWVKLGHHYSVTQFYSAAWSPTTGTLMGGAQDNGTLRLTKNGKPEDWSEVFGGDGGNCAADWKDGNYLYGEYVVLDVFRSSDGGQSADEISGEFWNDQDKQFEWKQSPYVIPDARDAKANFIAPFTLDPNNPNSILAGGASLWRTDDARTPNTTSSGPKWREIKAPELDNSTNPPSVILISAIAIPKQDSRIVWVGYNNGDIFATANADAQRPSWRKVNGKEQRPARIVTQIAVDPVDANTVYVTYGGYNEDGKKDNVWRTSTAGKAWDNVSGSLPSVPAFALTVHPQNHNYVYLGTEVGLFASEDRGSHWSPTTVEPRNEGPTNAAVMGLLWMNTTLVAVTHGRGLFTTDLNLPNTTK
jgi:photosystem II stability/assembly factor-like uncharacterized protein